MRGACSCFDLSSLASCLPPSLSWLVWFSVRPRGEADSLKQVCSVVYNALAIARKTSAFPTSEPRFMFFFSAESRWGLGLPLKLRPTDNTFNYKVVGFSIAEGTPWMKRL